MTPAEGDLYLWCRLGGGADSRGLARRSTASGVAFVSGEPFYGDGTGKHRLRLCFSGTPPDRIEAGVRRLARLMEAKPAESSPGTRLLV